MKKEENKKEIIEPEVAAVESTAAEAPEAETTKSEAEKSDSQEPPPDNIFRKTYGVSGLMEWKVFIPSVKNGMPPFAIHFSGGQITGFGVRPATYSTYCPVKQASIEKSRWFIDKKIKLL